MERETTTTNSNNNKETAAPPPLFFFSTNSFPPFFLEDEIFFFFVCKKQQSIRENRKEREREGEAKKRTSERLNEVGFFFQSFFFESNSRYKVFFSLYENSKTTYACSTGRTSGCDCATKRIAHLFLGMAHFFG